MGLCVPAERDFILQGAVLKRKGVARERDMILGALVGNGLV